MSRQALTIVLAAPRGFCAGVDRAVQSVEKALQKYGAPVYVRHEIVHNRFVVDSLKAKGAVFVDDLSECRRDRPVIFSAHGVPKSVIEDAERRGLTYLDATCPLVSKVHAKVAHHHAKGRQVLLVGHAGHPEVIGTMGQLPDGAVLLVENGAQAETIVPDDPGNLAYATQTTLAVDETEIILATLKRRFPALRGPEKDDICYATTNRQAAVKAIAPQCGMMLVIGAPNSSNSRRLAEVAKSAGCPEAVLIQRAGDIEWSRLEGVSRLGLTAGASASEMLIEEVVAACRERFDAAIVPVTTTVETMVFKLPKALMGG